MTGLLPVEAAVVDALDGSFDGDRLVYPSPGRRVSAFDAELLALGEAGRSRRTEFGRARVCAHAAVAALGREPEPILVGKHREPRWPDGLVGSLTHCGGYRAAAVAEKSQLLALGVDAEPDLPLPAGVAALALTEADRASSGRLGRFGNWDRLAFSARESVFKAWFAVTGRWLDFADATLSLLPDGASGGDFAATIGADVPGVRDLLLATGTAVLGGRYCRTRPGTRPGTPPLVLTAVTLRHRPGRREVPYPAGAGPDPSSPTVDHR